MLFDEEHVWKKVVCSVNRIKYNSELSNVISLLIWQINAVALLVNFPLYRFILRTENYFSWRIFFHNPGIENRIISAVKPQLVYEDVIIRFFFNIRIWSEVFFSFRLPSPSRVTVLFLLVAKKEEILKRYLLLLRILRKYVPIFLLFSPWKFIIIAVC